MFSPAPFADLAAEHQDWLSSFHPQFLVNWHKVYNDAAEAALSEAVIRRFLHANG